MPLQLDVRPIAAEQTHETIEQAADAETPRVERWPSRERDESIREAVELVERQRALAFRRAQFHARHQAAEVAIPVPAFTEDGKRPKQFGIWNSEFRIL